MSNTPYVEHWLSGPLSTSFYTRVYTPPSVPLRGALVFVHGYIEHIGRYDRAHSAWASRGFAVFAFDQRGFGRTALDGQRSETSAYGKTGSPDRMLDVEWAIRVTRGQFPDVPLFLMGHSMVCRSHFSRLDIGTQHRSVRPLQGGGVVLGFATQTQSPPDRETLSLLSGVIASSPFVHITHPPPLFVQWLLGKLRKVFPNANLSSPVQDKVCIMAFIMLYIGVKHIDRFYPVISRWARTH